MQSLRAKEGGRCGEQGECPEGAEEEVEDSGRSAIELPGRDQSAEDPVGGPPQPLGGHQRAGEQGGEPPADEHADDQPGQEDQQCPAHRAGAGPGVELPSGQYQDRDGGQTHQEAGHPGPGRVDDQVQEIGQEQQRQIPGDQPPRGPLPGADGGGEEQQEGGVGEVGADGDGEQVEEAGEGPQQGAQGWDDRDEGAVDAEGREERREGGGHPAPGEAAGQAAGPWGLFRGAAHDQHCKEAGGYPPVGSEPRGPGHGALGTGGGRRGWSEGPGRPEVGPGVRWRSAPTREVGRSAVPGCPSRAADQGRFTSPEARRGRPRGMGSALSAGQALTSGV